MSNRLEASRFDRGASRRTGWVPRLAPLLVALICAGLAIASVTVGQPHVDAPAIIG